MAFFKNPFKKDKIDQEIDQGMKAIENEEAKFLGLLLLGTGESGKTTILKQLRHLWGETYLANQRMTYRSIVWLNIIEAIKILITQSVYLKRDKVIDIEIEEKNTEYAEYILSVQESYFNEEQIIFDEEMYEAVKILWNDDAIQQTYSHRHLFYLIDTVVYLFENMKRFVGKDYIPTFEDFIRIKQHTTGITTEEFKLNNISFKVYDVGGQKSERRKWLQRFDNVTAIIYMCSLAGYSQVCWEDPNLNNLQDSWDIYEENLNYKEFQRINVILFLNKSDLFYELIKVIPFTKCVADFNEEYAHDKKEVITYIVDEFIKRTKGIDLKMRQIYFHVTCATNTELVREVFDDCKHIIMRKHLANSALLY